MSNDGAAVGVQSVLGFDVGARRIGVAVGNTLSGTARAVSVVRADDDGPAWDEVDRLVSAWKPARLIVGEPLTIDGEAQLATHRSRAFAAAARERYALPVDLVDERSTSREADRRFAERRRGGAARRKDAAALDAVAAEIIVERWLQDVGAR